ncbi:MAG: hydroxymethylglutaryl-CoA lyase [Thermoanaerobacteraceae bacterium]|nr:hydroxymethylglutaryl-CoA lyase [Thermoanaerobacteraceae bacterium]
MQWPEEILIREVGPRDGLQNEARLIPAEQKIVFIEKLVQAGLKAVEITSFVHPRAVPQLADAEEVAAGVRRFLEGVRGSGARQVVISALVGNRRGVERALAAGVEQVVMVISASEEHSRANMNMTIAQSLEQLREIAALAAGGGLALRGAVAVAFGCPYRGKVPPEQVLRIVEAMLQAGIGEITLADTAGLANPRQVYELVAGLYRRYPGTAFALHLHDTRGLALANIVTGIQAGVKIVESSTGGLGGCPFIPGATGNVATGEVVYLLHEMGIKTGVDPEKLQECVRWLEEVLGRKLVFPVPV